MLDLLMGGGRQHFERIGFFNNVSQHESYGWTTVTANTSEFIENVEDTDITIMPYMGLFGAYLYCISIQCLKLNDQGGSHSAFCHLCGFSGHPAAVLWYVITWIYDVLSYRY